VMPGSLCSAATALAPKPLANTVIVRKAIVETRERMVKLRTVDRCPKVVLLEVCEEAQRLGGSAL